VALLLRTEQATGFNVKRQLSFPPDVPPGGWPIGEWDPILTDPNQSLHFVLAYVHFPLTNGTAGDFPVIVMEPGFFFAHNFYNFIWKTLVPLGYVMVVLGSYDYDPLSDPLYMARDQAFMVDYLRKETKNPKSPVYGLISQTKSAAMGHSEGGIASFLANFPPATDHQYSVNFTTVVSLAGCWGDDDLIDDAIKYDKKPTLWLTGTQDCICDPDGVHDDFTSSLSRCKYFVNLNNGSHCYFANPNIVDETLCFNVEIAAGCGFVDKLDKDVQQRMVVEYVVPWFNWILKGDAGSQVALDKLLATQASKHRIQYEKKCG